MDSPVGGVADLESWSFSLSMVHLRSCTFWGTPPQMSSAVVCLFVRRRPGVPRRQPRGLLAAAGAPGRVEFARPRGVALPGLGESSSGLGTSLSHFLSS